MVDLEATPYLLADQATAALAAQLRDLERRVELLRGEGRLTEETLRRYYGQKRFEQVAESNALEGNTLSVGETELAVLKGVTISGHDPAFSRDARSLDAALRRLADMARQAGPTTIVELHDLHGLILGERPGAGIFRSQAVRITGAAHVPPATWRAVMAQMEAWQDWSRTHDSTPAPVRAVVLHAWLTHVHPYIDGNGRTARAVGNLELIRGGYPPIIVRKIRDRDRYVECLSQADTGDIGPFFDLVTNRIEEALRDLERSAAEMQGYDAERAALRRAQENRLAVFEAALALLVETLRARLEVVAVSAGARCDVRAYARPLTLDDYLDLCSGRAISQSWAFRIRLEATALAPVVRLAWLGYRSKAMAEALGPIVAASPSLYWSVSNPAAYPPWVRATDDQSPAGRELTLVGDEWAVLRGDGALSRIQVSATADMITRDLLASLR